MTYTQYFGYQPSSASILVEADFAGGGGTTYEVQISQTSEGWRSDAAIPATSAPPVPDPGPWARRVLSSDRIALPPAGRVDVAAGLVSDVVLRSMLEVAEQHRIGISVLISAHPVQIFATNGRNNHRDGLAYDIGTIDGQVGGPDDLDAGGAQCFSDPTDGDHVHVGFP